MDPKNTQVLLTVIALLLGGHLVFNVASWFVGTAQAQAGSIDCRIVGVSTYDKLPVQIKDIETNDTLKVKMERITSSYDALPVKVVDWDTNDTVKVQSR